MHGLRKYGLSASYFLPLLFACQPSQKVAKTALHAPAGIVVAGSGHDKFFVANTGDDALRVVTPQARLSDTDFLSSQAHYFPLAIPGGTGPTALAASADGKFVFTLDSTTGALSAFDADLAVPLQDGTGTPLSYPLALEAKEPTALVASALAACTSQTSGTQCRARVFVSARSLGDVVQVDLLEDASHALRLQITGRAHIGGAPQALAVHPTQPQVYVLDALAPEVVRLDVSNLGSASSGDANAVLGERFALGGRGEALALTGDGAFLIVSRSDLDDLIVMAGPQGVSAGVLEVLDADAIMTPPPSCLSPCQGPEEAVCAGAHPADNALCVSSSGIATANGNDYTALYLGDTATHLQSVSVQTSQQTLQVACRDGVAALTYDEVIVAAMRDGSLRWVGLTQRAGKTQIELIDAHFCQAPQLKISEEARSVLGALITPCGDLPKQRARGTCVAVDPEKGAQAGAAGVGLLRGAVAGTRVGIAWEGVLPGYDRLASGGLVDASGDFFDASAAFDANTIEVATPADSNRAAYAGDILEILTTPRSTPECAAALGLPLEACRLERRIVNVAPHQLTLDRPLPQACFFAGASLPYRIRAGDRFLVGAVTLTDAFLGTPVRLGPGGIFGPGRDPGLSTQVNFAIRPDVAIPASTDACARQSGLLPGPGMPAFMNRGQMIAFSVEDPFLPLQATSVSALTGRLPGGMAFLTASGRASTLAVTYAASNALALIQPYLPDTFGPTDNPNGVLLMH